MGLEVKVRKAALKWKARPMEGEPCFSGPSRADGEDLGALGRGSAWENIPGAPSPG